MDGKNVQSKFGIDNSALMGYHAANSVNSLPMFGKNLSRPSSRTKNLGLVWLLSTVRCKVAVHLGVWVAYLDGALLARGHDFQHLLQVHSDFPTTDLQKVFSNKIKRVQACIEAPGHHFQHLLIRAQRLSEGTVYCS
jgi:hypothetical protein